MLSSDTSVRATSLHGALTQIDIVFATVFPLLYQLVVSLGASLKVCRIHLLD